MSHPAPWRLLIHDPDDRGDPKFVLCLVASPGDVRPAPPAGEVDEVTIQWVAAPRRDPHRADTAATRCRVARR